MQAEETIEIDDRIRSVDIGGGAGNGDGGAEVVVALFAVRDHDVEAIRRAALEDGDEHFFAAPAVCHRPRERRAEARAAPSRCRPWREPNCEEKFCVNCHTDYLR